MSIERATGRRPVRWPWVVTYLAWTVVLAGLFAACHVVGDNQYDTGPVYAPSGVRAPLGFCVGKPLDTRWDYDIDSGTWRQVPITAPRLDNGYSPRFCSRTRSDHLE